MKSSLLLLALPLLWVASVAQGIPSGASTPDSEGYIRDWLLLAPIPLPEGADAGDLLLRTQIPDEAQLKPKGGDEIRVQGRTLTWKPVTATTNFVDLNAILNSQNDQAVGYLVTYVESDREIPDTILAVGSNDQGRIYFNGVDIYAFTEARPLVLDADRGKVTLKRGVNVFVFKIINVQNSWQGALRLTDRSGQPLKGIRIQKAP
ncbi:MAG: hypothetical protein JNL10_10655 [Verrucomicrobiales bacterium]|nr:hypothetical protein [Verrucomicrobiales bacterium]